MEILAGKRALIVGVASNRSIAWGIAAAMAREGAEIAYTYQNEAQSRVEELAAQTGSRIMLPLDVAEDQQIDDAFTSLRREWPHLDVIVHSVAFAPREQLSGSYVEAVTREGFRLAHDISSYSFVALAKGGPQHAVAFGAHAVTLTYLGAVRTLPNYNVMGPAKASLEANVRFMAADLGASGIRVNGISAGPIKTLAAAGIGGIRSMLQHTEKTAPLRRNVSIEEVGNAAAFLCSDLATGITGQILYVDAGFHIVGMSPE